MHDLAQLDRSLATHHTVSCQVLLNDIEVVADIGALAIEFGVPQPLRVHVALSVVPPQDDELAQTFNYATIREYALDLAGQRTALIETFAQRLAHRCLASDLVLEAEVRIDKPWAVPGCLAGTRVKVCKS